ncbi:hypothetical protein BJY24_005712 [Nocardia transvalensis]|uniref:Uncharacterized protein n=1 Tax=Nocardia transvalensis TaxID=37333 RepID=A0A7W9ULK4_9NOCA|nr:hypothetical protein [Nocardia transvalensis]MBB5916800.1 hypothetical protein [Nocardia transvalensis]
MILAADSAPRVSGLADLAALGAGSIVVQGLADVPDRVRPFQRGDDGYWYSHGIGGGVSSERLWRTGDDLVVVSRSDRPVTAGATQIDRVRAFPVKSAC